MNAPSELKRGLNLSPRSVCVLSGLFFVLSTSFYSAAQQPPEQGQRRGPPPEAFAACEAAAQNDSCVVETRRGEISGTCQLDRREQKTLLCVPANRPPRGGEDGENQTPRPDTEPEG